MQRVLVATDLSQRSDRAIRRAFRIAAQLGGRLDIAHVVDDDLPPDLVEARTEQARTLIDRFVTTVPEAGRAPHEVHVRPGDVPGEIRAMAQDLAADLVVIGTHRSRPFMDLFRETTVHRLARLAPVPILLVRDTSDRDYATVLAAIDFSPASAAACRTARALAPGAALRGFHAVHVPYRGIESGRVNNEARYYVADAKQQLEQWSTAHELTDVAAATRIYDGGLGQGFQRALAEVDPDLIVLGANARPDGVTFTIGSFASSLMNDPPRDLLIAHPPRLSEPR